MSTSVWHPGEYALQTRAGVAARMAEHGPRLLRDHMPDQHRDFFALLPYVVAGTVDDTGQPHVRLLTGPPGFAHSPDPRLLRLEVPGTDLACGAPIGLLGLQAHTGRRNRMNGRIARVDDRGIEVRVAQSFGNCPKYITRREAHYQEAALPACSTELAALDATARAMIVRADTFFIATAHPDAARSDDPAAGIDVSHRGGPAGFVQVQDERTLLVPDFVGNSFFNTYGNLQLEPRCALLFVDFATGDRLHLTARAEVLWHGDQRMLRLALTGVTRTKGGLPLRWSPAAGA
jgi:predicted pyridoxine 5'-phosphate oxidase superfamily flavin-nucleotide-binding protein